MNKIICAGTTSHPHPFVLFLHLPNLFLKISILIYIIVVGCSLFF